MREDARVVAGLAEDVEVLGRPRDARIGRQRIGAGEQEGQAELVQLPQRLGVEGLGFRVFEGRLRLGIHDRHARIASAGFGGASWRFMTPFRLVPARVAAPAPQA